MISESISKNHSLSEFLEAAKREKTESQPFPYTLEVCRCRYCSYCQNGKCSLRRCCCIYDRLRSGNESERNLEGWLHKIINEMADYGYGEREMILVQLLYAGSLAEAEYRYDVMDALRVCIPTEKEATVKTWLRNVQNIFDVNLLDNVAFLDYLEGKTAYENGVMG